MAGEGLRGIVRIFGSDSTQGPNGTGFLVGSSHILTCAHILSKCEERPAQQFTVDFPFRQDDTRHPCSVHSLGWWPYRESQPADGRADVAVLELAAPVAEVDPLSLGHDTAGARLVRSYGFPKDHDLGQWIEGKLALMPRADGWLQISGGQQVNYFIEPGFSGGPVFPESGEQVIGIVSQYD